MTVAELRAALADLPDDLVVLVDGYEDGFDEPRIQRHVAVDNGEDKGSRWYCGRWQRFHEGDDVNGAVDVLVLGR